MFNNENDACVFIYNELEYTVKWAKEKDINL